MVKLNLLIVLALGYFGCERSSFYSVRGGTPNAEIPSSEYSTITITTDNWADGVTPAEITVQVNSMTKKPMAGVTIGLTVTGLQNVIVPCTISDANGWSRCKVYTTFAEDKLVRINGKISLAGQTVFKPMRWSKGAGAIVVAASNQVLVSGRKVILTAGAIEAPNVMKDSGGTRRLHSSVQGLITSED